MSTQNVEPLDLRFYFACRRFSVRGWAGAGRVLRCADSGRGRSAPQAARSASAAGVQEHTQVDAARRTDRISFRGQDRTLQLLTSAREAPRPGGKQDANVGVSRVPDERLDRLTALFNPKKHVPATVEFADMGGVGGAQGRRGRAARRRAVPQCRRAAARRAAVSRPAVPHPAGSVDPARDVRTMEDEVILADLGVVERRLERLERDAEEGAGNAELQEGTGDSPAVPRGARRRARRCARCSSAAEDAKRLRGFQFLSAKPLLLVLNLDEARSRRSADRAVEMAGLQDVLDGRRDPRRSHLREDRARDRAARAGRRACVHGGSGAARVGARSRDPRQLRPARLHLVLHRRRGRKPRLVDSARHAGAARRRRDSHRHPARLHPRRSRPLRASAGATDRSPPAAITASCASRARNTSCSTAT